VTILLDENFPLGLVRRLRADGLVAEHIITLGWRGASDARIRIRERLQDRELVFLTHDEDFLFGQSVPAVVVISRVRQARPLMERIEIRRAR
jgi:predicted nuclease of predicted toxin-antitoxin system